MACGCSRGRGRAAAPGETFIYRVTLPTGATLDVATPIEARRETRRAGGGTITRVRQPAAAR